MKKKKPQPPAPVAQVTPSPVQERSFELSGAERQSRNEALGMAKPVINRFTETDASGSTPFRRALTQQKYTGAANAYENARARTRERGAAAGFGYDQPVTYGAETALANEQAGRLASIPGEVELAAVEPEFRAASLAQELAAGYSPLQYYGEGVGLESLRQQNIESELDRRFQAEENRKKRKAGLFGGIARIGAAAAAAPFTGGASLVGIGGG